MTISNVTLDALGEDASIEDQRRMMTAYVMALTGLTPKERKDMLHLLRTNDDYVRFQVKNLRKKFEPGGDWEKYRVPDRKN